MKLHTSPLSPFARKVHILAQLKNIELEYVPAVKGGAKGYTAGVNPLGKVPALDIGGDVVLYDSPVICDYIDSLETPILPAAGDARWAQLQLHALGDGISEAVYNYRYEIVRDEGLHWDAMIERHETAVRSAVLYLETCVDTLGAPWEFGNLSIICALDYADFRAGHLEWRNLAPKLSVWHAKFTSEPAWKDTYAY